MQAKGFFFCSYQLVYEVLPFVLDNKLGRNDSVVNVVSPLTLDEVQSLRS